MSDSSKTRRASIGKLSPSLPRTRDRSPPTVGPRQADSQQLHESVCMRHSIPLMAVLATGAVTGVHSGPVPAPAPPLSAIAFMTGCWTGPSSNGATIEERYSEPSDNLMIGMSRYVRAGE